MDLRLCKKIMFRAFRINWRTFESEEKIRSNHPVINYFLIWSGPMGGFSFLPFFSISGRRKKSSKKKLGKQASQPAFPILQTFFWTSSQKNHQEKHVGLELPHLLKAGRGEVSKQKVPNAMQWMDFPIMT